jgi:hypothetical protein
MKFKNLKTNIFINAVGFLAQDLIKDKDYRLAVDADFNESDHIRDKDGKFVSGSGNSKNSETSEKSKSTNKLTLKAESIRNEIKAAGIKARIRVAPGGGQVQVISPSFETKFKESELKIILKTMEKNGFTNVQGIPIDVERQSQLIGKEQFNFYLK